MKKKNKVLHKGQITIETLLIIKLVKYRCKICFTFYCIPNLISFKTINTKIGVNIIYVFFILFQTVLGKQNIIYIKTAF